MIMFWHVLEVFINTLLAWSGKLIKEESLFSVFQQEWVWELVLGPLCLDAVEPPILTLTQKPALNRMLWSRLLPLFP